MEERLWIQVISMYTKAEVKETSLDVEQCTCCYNRVL